MVELEEALALKARETIYRTIQRAPGLHFRELQRRTGLAIGSLQYHLDYLLKAHLIRVEKHGKFSRYYTVRGKQLGESTKAMALLRQRSTREIVLFLLTRRSANNTAISRKIGLSPSTTSWHLAKLTGAGVLGKRRRGRKTFFYIQEPENIAQLLVGYRRSFLDDAVNGFVQIWKEMEG